MMLSSMYVIQVTAAPGKSLAQLEKALHVGARESAGHASRPTTK